MSISSFIASVSHHDNPSHECAGLEHTLRWQAPWSIRPSMMMFCFQLLLLCCVAFLLGSSLAILYLVFSGEYEAPWRGNRLQHFWVSVKTGSRHLCSRFRNNRRRQMRVLIILYLVAIPCVPPSLQVGLCAPVTGKSFLEIWLHGSL